jgi:uncharacterized protein (TIGR02271 family)
MAAKPTKAPRGPTDEALPMREIKPEVIPVIQEQATIAKRVVETGRVRIVKHVREYEEMADVPHFQEEVRVERVPVNQFVDQPPTVRTEGDVTIIPVLEERYVVEKKLFVVEELHVRKERHESHQPQPLKVLKEHVAVERLAPDQINDPRPANARRGR